MDTTETTARYPAAVEETLARLPARPGCYLFKDAEGAVLYVGKAESLRDRVRSYFRGPNSLSLKNRGLVPRIAAIDYQIVSSATEALLLEYNLIKQHNNPPYNIVLRDDKTYLSIRITDEPYPRIEAIHRRRGESAGRYFGPYTSAQSVYRTLDLLKRLFPYRSCRLNIQPPRPDAPETPAPPPVETPVRRATRRGRTARNADGPPQQRILTVAGPQNRACLEYHIHRCTAPCIDAISQEDYARIIEQASLFLQGRAEQVLSRLQQGMDEAAEALDFERAARLRDQIAAVRRVTERQRVTVADARDRDIIGLARADDEACVELIPVREGRMLGHKQFVLQRVAEQDDAALLDAFLTQYYVIATELPDEVLLPAEPEDHAALAALLAERKGRKVEILIPQRGDKAALVDLARQNASDAAEQRRLKWQSDSQKITQALHDLQTALDLPRLPMRIECYDISTFQGTSTVGSMVVFEHGKPKTAAYRRFQIKTVQGTDDFASMAEMVRRRLKRAGTGDGSPQKHRDTERDGEIEIEADATTGGYAEASMETAPESSLVDRSGSLTAPTSGAIPAYESGSHPVATGVVPSIRSQPEAPATQENPDPGEWTRRPDLMLIDGGKGQLGAVVAVLEELGITDQPLASLAKQHEEIFLPGRPTSILLPAGSQALFLVQRVRDEAHRFAITYHRNVRGKRGLESSLDSVPGVGPRRKKDLLRHFGSLAALRRAGLDEIAALPGIGPRTALAIKEHLGEG